MTNIGVLRNIDDAELELVLSWRNAPSVRANMYTRHEISLEEHKQWWQRVRKKEDQKYFMYEKSLKPLGVVSFSMIDHVNGNCAWAFYASPDALRGTGSKMEFLALEYAFNDLGLHKIYCEVLDFNTPVINLHKKFGFQIEGIFRSHHKTDAGYADVYRMGLLNSDWGEIRSVMHEKVSR